MIILTLMWHVFNACLVSNTRLWRTFIASHDYLYELSCLSHTSATDDFCFILFCFIALTSGNSFLEVYLFIHVKKKIGIYFSGFNIKCLCGVRRFLHFGFFNLNWAQNSGCWIPWQQMKPREYFLGFFFRIVTSLLFVTPNSQIFNDFGLRGQMIGIVACYITDLFSAPKSHDWWLRVSGANDMGIYLFLAHGSRDRGPTVSNPRS